MGQTVPRKGAAKPRLTNTVALAALRSRRYLSRYFSFWLFLGSLFILALPDSGVRGSEARPLSTLMIRLLGGLRAAEGDGADVRTDGEALHSRVDFPGKSRRKLRNATCNFRVWKLPWFGPAGGLGARVWLRAAAGSWSRKEPVLPGC